MELRHLTMVNWHLFDAEDVEVAGNFGILGENRSGKSTILDMVQAVLTGASRTYMRLNAVAGEAARGRSSSKRSVFGYCLGTLGEGETCRQDSQTYVSLGFVDPAGTRPPVTIGLALEARATDSSETILGRFVVTGKILTTADFVEQRADGRYVSQWDDVKARIASELGAASIVNHRNRATDFVREYMRRLVPGLPSAEQSAKAMLKAVVNAMSLNQGYSATEFVRRFILEENPIRIGELRQSIETYRGVNATIANMRRKLDALKVLRTHVETYVDARDRAALGNWTARRGRWLSARAANHALLYEIADERRLADAESEDRTYAMEAIREARAEIDRLTATITAREVKSGRQQWTQALRQADERKASLGVAMERLRASAAILAPGAAALGSGVGDFCMLAAGGIASLDVERLLVAEQAFAAVAPSVTARLGTHRRQVSVTVANLESEISGLREALEDAGGSRPGAHLSGPTRDLIRRLEAAGMDARPLCELVEVSDPEWIPAAEALLARDREAVFVPRNRIGEATSIFRDGRRELRGASLVSLNKLEEHRERPRTGTFPSVFATDHADAMAFLQRRHGNVRLAKTMAEFELPGRALMLDGLYDDGLLRSHRSVPPTDHKLGRAARAGAFERMREELAGKAIELDAARREERGIEGILRALHVLAEEASGSLSSLVADMRALDVERREIEASIAAIDREGDGGLGERLVAQREFLRRKQQELETIEERSRKHEVAIKVAERNLSGGEGQEGSTMALKIARRAYLVERTQFPYREGRTSYRERLDPSGETRAAASPSTVEGGKAGMRLHARMERLGTDAARAAEGRRHRAELDARGSLRDYFAEFGPSSQVGPESDLLSDVRSWMEVLIEEIEGNELRKYEDRAREAAERASVLFRGEFVNALNARVSKMERDIDALNRSLRDHPFHNETYSFHRTAEAEFLPILKIIEIGRLSDDALDMLFRADVPDDFPHIESIRAVERLLEDPDKDFSAFEDYRNFHSFEIQMQDVDTKARTRWETRRATGSGAEQQVPLYVAIGASLASVYGSGSEARGRPRGMAPALFDEAFSKMDGKNQRAMMAFYDRLGLQVVIAAPLEKKAALMGYMETLVEVDRIGKQSTTDVVRIKPKARDALLAINPENLSDADVVNLMAAE